MTCTMSTLTVVSCTASLSTSTSTQGTSLLTRRLAATCSTGLWRAKAVPQTTRWCCVRHHTTALVLCASSPTPHHVHGFVARAGMNGGPGCSSILGVCVCRALCRVHVTLAPHIAVAQACSLSTALSPWILPTATSCKATHIAGTLSRMCTWWCVVPLACALSVHHAHVDRMTVSRYDGMPASTWRRQAGSDLATHSTGTTPLETQTPPPATSSSSRVSSLLVRHVCGIALAFWHSPTARDLPTQIRSLQTTHSTSQEVSCWRCIPLRGL